LLVWLAGILASQSLGYGGLAGLALLVGLGGPQIFAPWWQYLRRARWLLLTLWLILAYNTPGEAFQEFAWAPTYEGMTEATLQAARLVVMLGLLAWLFARLGRDGLVSGLWGLMRPFAACGLDTTRLVVRLSLVLDNLQTAHAKGAWKKMLAGEPGFAGGPAALHLGLPVWTAGDTLVVVAAVAFLVGAILW
jgi:energy-coupling factor transporter transmembrane protein EcfT